MTIRDSVALKHGQTEVQVRVASTGPLVALLNASPAVFIALGVLQKSFSSELRPNAWLPKLKEISPSYGESLIEDADLCRRIRVETARVPHLEYV
jgi:malate dehydrogenase (quinone)